MLAFLAEIHTNSSYRSNHEHVEIVWLHHHLKSTIKPGRSSLLQDKQINVENLQFPYKISKYMFFWQLVQNKSSKRQIRFTALSPKRELHNKIDKTANETVTKDLYVCENCSVSLMKQS